MKTKQMDDPKTFTVMLEQDDKDWIREQANADGMTASQWMRRLIKRMRSENES